MLVHTQAEPAIQDEKNLLCEYGFGNRLMLAKVLHSPLICYIILSIHEYQESAVYAR